MSRAVDAAEVFRRGRHAFVASRVPLKLGQRKGALSYDDINKLLPANEFSPEVIDELITKLGTKGVKVVEVAEGLELVSLTQILAWDLPLDAKLRAKVADHAHTTLLGTVSLAAKSGHKEIAAGAKRNSKKVADVLLRYNFPAAGLSDDALRTLVLMVLATGSDVRRALI